MKRIVTGVSPEGKSVVLFEGQPARVSTFPNLPGMSISEIWATDANPTAPVAGEDPTESVTEFIAPIGDTRFRMEVFPPDKELAEMARKGRSILARPELSSRPPCLISPLLWRLTLCIQPIPSTTTSFYSVNCGTNWMMA